jgi:hypothetical protein
VADDIVVGSVGVEVVPDARGFGPRTAAQIDPEMKALGRQVGQQLGRDMAADIAPEINRAVRDGASGTRGQGTRGGTEFGGAFADGAKARIAAAFRDLPKAKVGTDATELDAELVSIRARLEALHSIRIGVDLDAGAALAEIEAVKIRLTELAAKSPHIDVKVDATRAAAELALVSAEVKALSATDAQVKIGGQAGSGLGGLVSDVASLGPAGLVAAVAMAALATTLIPIAAGIAAVAASALLLGSILGGAFIAAAAGLYPIIKALTAMSAADKQSAQSATAAAAARVNANAAVQSATASLANTVANADSAAIRSAEAVTQARTRLADAERQAARSIASALQGEQSAEHSLTIALREQGDAQVALTQARKDAQRQIEDLQRAVTDGALDQKQAELDIKAARQRLQDVNSNPLSTIIDRQQAKLDFDQAVQRLDDLRAANLRLGQDAADAAAKGVNGADTVLAAQQRLVDAIDATARARQADALAAQAVDDARLQAAEQIASAEQSVTDALRAQADQARQSAFAIQQAQAGLASAQRAQKQAAEGITTAAQKAKSALAGLGPEAALFVTFLHDEFLPAIKKVISAAAEGLAPGLMAGLITLQPVLPDIAKNMGKFARAVGDLFADLARGLASDGARKFFDFLANLSGPALKGVGRFLRDVGSGIAGLLEAFAPFAKDIGREILKLADKFRDFGNSSGEGGSLDKFVAWLHKNGPQIATDLAAIAVSVAALAVSLADLGTSILHVTAALAPLTGPASAGLKVLDLLPGTIPMIETLSKKLGGLKSAFTIVQGVASGFVSFLGNQLAKAISKIAAPLITAGVDVSRAFGTIKKAALDARDYIMGRFDVLVGFVEGLPARITKAASGMWDGLTGAFKSAMNFIIDAWNGLDLSVDVNVPGWVPGIGGKGFHIPDVFPDIPRLAQGALVSAPTLAWVGEGHESEMVTPLSALGDFGQWAKELGWSQAMASAPIATTGHSNGPRTVIERLDIHNPLPESATESTAKAMQRLEWVLS